MFRGIAILAVVLAHTPVQSATLDLFRPLGALGVHMFFALSGFLITFRLIEEFDQRGRIDLAGFYRRRARRIVPPAVIYLSLLALLGPALHVLPSTLREISGALFFYRNVYQPALPDAWYTAHFWTLSLEEQFYLFWPSVLVFCGPARRRTIWIALGMVAACALWRIYVQRTNPSANIYRPDLIADHLLWGCLFGMSWRRLQQDVSFSVRKWAGITGIPAATLLLYWQPPFWQPFFAFLVSLGFIFSAEAAQDWAARIGPLITMGKASYDCYIWQSLFLPLPLAGLALPVWQSVPWNYAGIVIVTSASYLLTFPRRGKGTGSLLPPKPRQ